MEEEEETAAGGGHHFEQGGGVLDQARLRYKAKPYEMNSTVGSSVAPMDEDDIEKLE